MTRVTLTLIASFFRRSRWSPTSSPPTASANVARCIGIELEFYRQLRPIDSEPFEPYIACDTSHDRSNFRATMVANSSYEELTLATYATVSG